MHPHTHTYTPTCRQLYTLHKKQRKWENKENLLLQTNYTFVLQGINALTQINIKQFSQQWLKELNSTLLLLQYEKWKGKIWLLYFWFHVFSVIIFILLKRFIFPLKWCDIGEEDVFVSWAVEFTMWAAFIKNLPNPLCQCQNAYSAIDFCLV